MTKLPANSAETTLHLPTPELLHLTPREWDVLVLVADDLTNAEIAEQLCITTKSVENYRTRISDKLNQKGCRKLLRFTRKHLASIQAWYQLARRRFINAASGNMFLFLLEF